MSDMIEIPATRHGRSHARHVPADSLLRLEVRVPAPVMQWLAHRANTTGASVASLVSSDLNRLMASDSATYGEAETT